MIWDSAFTSQLSPWLSFEILSSSLNLSLAVKFSNPFLKSYLFIQQVFVSGQAAHWRKRKREREEEEGREPTDVAPCNATLLCNSEERD